MLRLLFRLVASLQLLAAAGYAGLVYLFSHMGEEHFDPTRTAYLIGICLILGTLAGGVFGRWWQLRVMIDAPIAGHASPDDEAEIVAHLSPELGAGIKAFERQGDWLKVRIAPTGSAMCDELVGNPVWIRWRALSGTQTVAADDKYDCG